MCFAVQMFQSATHRKIAMYYARSDSQDSNGHGTHTSGTLAGYKYGTDPLATPDTATGIAPGAKLSFIDLSSQSNNVVSIAGASQKLQFALAISLHQFATGYRHRYTDVCK
jgi:hypothetical protein